MDTKTLCLAVLHRQPASGYEIKKTLDAAPYSHFQDSSFGALYPALARLQEEGAIAVNAQAQDKRPDKKVYSLTEVGRARLVEALMRPPADDKYRSDFLLVLFMGDLLPQDHVIEVIDARIAELENQVGLMRTCDMAESAPGQRFVHGFGLAYYEFAADWLRRNRDRLAEDLAPRRSDNKPAAPQRRTAGARG